MENHNLWSMQKDFAQWILHNESFIDEYFDFNNEEDFEESLGYFSSQPVSLNREENEQESLFTECAVKPRAKLKKYHKSFLPC